MAARRLVLLGERQPHAVPQDLGLYHRPREVLRRHRLLRRDERECNYHLHPAVHHQERRVCYERLDGQWKCHRQERRSSLRHLRPRHLSPRRHQDLARCGEGGRQHQRVRGRHHLRGYKRRRGRLCRVGEREGEAGDVYPFKSYAYHSSDYGQTEPLHRTCQQRGQRLRNDWRYK